MYPQQWIIGDSRKGPLSVPQAVEMFRHIRPNSVHTANRYHLRPILTGSWTLSLILKRIRRSSMKREIFTTVALLLTLTACGGQDRGVPPDDSPSASSVADETATPARSSSPTKNASQVPTPEPTTSAVDQAPRDVPTELPTPVLPDQQPTPFAQPVDPATLTPGEWCELYQPTTSGGIQTCHGIAQGYIDPVTGTYIGEQQPANPAAPEDADPTDPSTWQGIDPETGEDWAVIGPPPGVSNSA